ncbi:MAG: hypothetical protein N2484_03515 [Clostridia bacterium]|nr:hypothetical protein [Clostridia bacterium]
MSIKPVDFQVMLPKTADVSKIHTDEQQKLQALQQQQTSSSQHRVEDHLRQVHAQEKAQEVRIREKEEKNQKNKREEEKKKEKSKANYNKDKGLETKEHTSTIDIRL